MMFESDCAYEALAPHFQKRIHRQEPLASHSSFGVGGLADLWVTVETQSELTNLVTLCAEQRWPLLAIGCGTNILFADAGVRGVVARIALHNYHLEEQSADEAIVIAESGVRWTQLLRDLVPLGWGGLEFGVGIPGTLGGGVVSNAGAHEQSLGQVLEWIEVLDARGCNDEEKNQYTPPLVRRYQQRELDLGYRHSRFREQRLTRVNEAGQLMLSPRALIEPPEVITTVGLRLHRQDPKVLCALLDQHSEFRKHADPTQLHAGSIFKDPPGATARELIEQAGLRGKMQGKVGVSERDGNYLVNYDYGNASDMLALIVEVHQQVLHTCGVHLALNIELLGEWSSEQSIHHLLSAI